MILLKGFARAGAVTAVLAMLLSLGLTAGSTAYAQQSPPYLAYGTGVSAGDTVAAPIDGVDCVSATADADGQWQLEISEGGDCGAASGDTVNFTLNGDLADETVSWSSAGTPGTSGYSAATGIPLTISGATVTPPDTGNAGLLAGQGTSPWLAFGLGVFALAMLAGARTVTRRAR
ncbi:MAG: hypothetical protein IIA44_10980 [Acidobacteria bacterium]|nr:hypothetical protein [Acidobacteriota bacterium]